MHGPTLLAAALSRRTIADKFGNVWQYHSRSDRHSKVACWGVAFDLLLTSRVLRRHAEQGAVVLGVNQQMTDFATGRRKDLDLVVARPVAPPGADAPTFAQLASKWQIPLNEAQHSALAALPPLSVGVVNAGAVLVALEAKATMTAHIKSLPRLYDELSSSHLCVHGASSRALAVGLVLVNAAQEFLSPGLNTHDLQAREAIVSRHRQPRDLQRTIEKVREVNRRSSSAEHGFDSVGVVVVDMRNDGTPVTLVESPPAPRPGDADHYDNMIVRTANEYDAAFRQI